METKKKEKIIVCLRDGSEVDISLMCFQLFDNYSAEESAVYLRRCVELWALDAINLAQKEGTDVDKEHASLIGFLHFVADALYGAVFPMDGEMDY